MTQINVILIYVLVFREIFVFQLCKLTFLIIKLEVEHGFSNLINVCIEFISLFELFAILV